MCSRKLQIERSQGFVQQQHVGSRTRLRAMGHALTLAARQLVDALVRGVAQSHRSSIALLRLSLSALGVPRRANPNATFSPTDIIGNRASC